MLLTGGAAVACMVSKKLAEMRSGTPESLKVMAKLGLAIGLSSMAVKWAQHKKYLPVDPFKSS